MKGSKATYIVLGIIMSALAILYNGADIYVGQFPNDLMIVAMAIICFCMAYLAPHFEAKDERAQKIRERAVYMSYFWVLGFSVILMIVFNPISNINMASFEVVSLLMALFISIVFLNMAYYAKKY